MARRQSDYKKVLVTNLHVVSTDNWRVDGDDYMYQGGTTEDDKVGRLYTETRDGVVKKSYVPVITRLDGQDLEYDNYFDIAALLLHSNVSDMDAKFQLHDHPNHGPVMN